MRGNVKGIAFAGFMEEIGVMPSDLEMVLNSYVIYCKINKKHRAMRKGTSVRVRVRERICAVSGLRREMRMIFRYCV